MRGIAASTDGRPFFVYSQEVLAGRSRHLQKSLAEILPSRVTEFYYSLKTNSNCAVVETLTDLGWGLDVSSVRELDYATSVIGPERIQFSGCAKESHALKRSAESRIRRHHIDSLDEWNVLKAQSNVNLCLRVSVEALREISTRFGLQLDDFLSDVFALKHGLSLVELDEIFLQSSERRLSGLHFYLGREQYSPQRLETVAKVLTAVCQTSSSRFISDWSLSIGPGLPTSMPNFSFNNLENKHAIVKLPHVSFEIGRALVGPAGSYVAQVLSVKEWENGRRTVIINGGLQHLGGSIRPIFLDSQNDCGDDRQNDELHLSALRSNGKNVELLNARPGQRTMRVTVFGSLCLGHDVVLAKVHVPTTLKRGDWLVFSNAGAYGLSAGVPRFISQDLPREFLSKGEEIEDVTHAHFQLGIYDRVI